MKTITLAAGATHVPFNEVAHLIAYAINPETSDGDNPTRYQFALNDLETELKKAAKLGILPVKNPLTLGVWESPMGNAFNHVLVTVDDLRAFVADKYIKVVVEATEPQAAPATDTATPAPVDDEDDAESWKDKARVLAAEIIKRQRGRNLYPSQENLGDEIAREFRSAGIVGADGKPLSGAYIKRHALNGISSAQGKQLSTQTGRGKQGK